MKTPKVLVTGADGFIGSHLTEQLVLKGYEVSAFALYNSFNHWGHLELLSKDVLSKVNILSGDVRDKSFVHRAVEGHDVVLHLASLIAIPYSYVAPQSYIDTNVIGALNLLEAAKAHKIERFIHTSTSEVYGSALTVPIDESHPLQPQSPYSASKMSADHLALSYYNSFELPVTVVRPFNTFGPRQSARAVIPTIITQIANGQTNLKLGALSPTRDFNFVLDTVDAFIKAIHAKDIEGEIINVGSGYEISIENLAHLIAKLMDAKISIECDEQRLRPEGSEVDRLLADATKAKKLLDWSPSLPGEQGLAQGLEQTIEWFSQPEHLAKYKLGYNV